MKVKFKKAVRLQGGSANPGDVREISDRDARFLMAIKACEPTTESPAAKVEKAIEAAIEKNDPAPKKKPGRPPKNRAADVEETRGE